MHDALLLYDHIRRDFRDLHNESGGRAGRMNIVDEAGKNRMLDFPFAQLEPNKYRLTKGAAYPMLAAFRNMVEVDDSGNVEWRGGFKAVLRLWKEAVRYCDRDLQRYRGHRAHTRSPWEESEALEGYLHMKLQLRLLRAQLEDERARKN